MINKIKEPQPSQFSKWLIKKIFKDEGEEKLGDFMEIYSTLAEEKGRLQARLRFWAYLIRSIPEYFKDSLYMGGTMFKNYIKIATRNIKRDKWHTLLNTTGLTVGMACFILIMLYVKWEFSYDKFHERADRIYRVICKRAGRSSMDKDASALIPAPAAQALVEEYPEVINATRIRSWNTQGILFTYKDKNFYGGDGLFADKNFFDIFSFRLAKGDAKTALAEPFSVVITEELAQKYFRNEDPFGKNLVIHHWREDYNAKITGIIKELPKNSHIQFDFLVSHNSYRITWGEDRLKDWNNFTDCTYVELHKDADYRELEKKFPAFIEKHGGNREVMSLLLQPLVNIHLKSDVNFEISVNNNMSNIYIFSLTAFVILIIACINYMNLATARASRRTKEVGIRKVVGALRNQLIKQFIGESLILIIIAFLFAAAIATAVLPSFNAFIDREINLNVIEIIKFFPWLVSVIIFVGIVSGFYPALFISSFQPVRVLKGVYNSFSKKSGMRNILVIVQFGISMILIMGTIIIVKQLNYIRTKDVGFNREQILVVNIRDENIQNNYQSIKNTLLQYHEILGTSLSWHLPSNIGMMNAARVEKEPAGEEARFSLFYSKIDQEFLNVFEIEILSGRNFSENFANEAQESVIINETAARQLGWKDPIGKKFKINTASSGRVIGVVEDFHFHSLHSPIKPLVFLFDPSGGRLAIKIRTGDIKNTIDFVKRSFEAYDSKYPFEYFFFDDSFNEMYRAEQKLGSLFSFFSSLGIFIACLGLFGLASFKAEVYTKEIGIRKVLGASVSAIVVQLSKEFIKWIMIANAVALPIAYFAMNKWLQNFAYRTNISIWTFIQSIVIALIAALVSVGYQSVKAAAANPVDSLRYE
jgi:putative ABC transport system permease protein